VCLVQLSEYTVLISVNTNYPSVFRRTKNVCFVRYELKNNAFDIAKHRSSAVNKILDCLSKTLVSTYNF